jgi:hypothetical protein
LIFRNSFAQLLRYINWRRFQRYGLHPPLRPKHKALVLALHPKLHRIGNFTRPPRQRNHVIRRRLNKFQRSLQQFQRTHQIPIYSLVLLAKRLPILERMAALRQRKGVEEAHGAILK